MDQELEQLRNKYYQSIIWLQNPEDIKEALPTPDFKNFPVLIRGVIENIDLDIKETKELLEKETDEESIEYMQEELNNYTIKKDACEKLIAKAKEDEKIEEEAENTSGKSLIFATTEKGNVSLENDLKDIPEEYYPSVLECLKRIKDNYQGNNNEKTKSLVHDDNIAGVHEMKEFKIRVFYRFLTNDTAYVLGTTMKKDDNSRKYKEFIAKRRAKTEKQFKDYKKNFKEELNKMNAIKENEEIEKRIMKQIENSKRGVKGD